jgi:hypothetical protein
LKEHAVGHSSTAEDPRQRAVDSARRLLKERGTVFAATGALALLGSAVAAVLPIGGSMLAVWVWVAMSGAAAGWLALTMFPRTPRHPESGFAVNVVDQPRLYEWAVDLSRRIGVSAPGVIRIAPATGAWLDDLDGDPTLVIGAGSFGWLTQAELERTVGLELAMLRVRDDETVVAALRLARSVRPERLARSRAPVVGFAIRLLGRRFAERSDDLRDACVAWAMHEAPVDLTPTDDDLKEATLVDEAWTLLDERWLAPAARLGLALDSIGLAHRELLVACDENGLIERAHERDDGPLAMTLLNDPVDVDIELAGWAAAQLTSGGDGIVAWDEYANRVAVPTWRQTAADAVAAVATASGRSQPPTIDALVKAVDSGLGIALGTEIATARERALRPDADPPLPTDREIDTALSDSVAHSVCLALVETGMAAPTLDILWGVGLADEDGKKIEVDHSVRSFIAAGDISGLRWYLQSLGLDTSRPLPLEGAIAVSAFPDDVALIAWQGWRAFDLVVADGALLGFRHSLRAQVGGMISRLTGSYQELRVLDDELATALAADDPDERPAVQLALELDGVTRAELYRTPRGSSWTLRLQTRSGATRLSGVGDAHLVTRLLEPRLGERLQHTGLSMRPNPFAVAIGKASWYTIWGGVLVLLAGVVGLLNILQASSQQTSGTQAMDVVLTFGVFGAALIAIGLVPYRFIARRGHQPTLR